MQARWALTPLSSAVPALTCKTLLAGGPLWLVCSSQVGGWVGWAGVGDRCPAFLEVCLQPKLRSYVLNLNPPLATCVACQRMCMHYCAVPCRAVLCRAVLCRDSCPPASPHPCSPSPPHLPLPGIPELTGARVAYVGTGPITLQTGGSRGSFLDGKPATSTTPPSPPAQLSGAAVGAIAGAVVGVVLLTTIVVAIVAIRRRNKKRDIDADLMQHRWRLERELGEWEGEGGWSVRGGGMCMHVGTARVQRCITTAMASLVHTRILMPLRNPILVL
jgi:hypothetical protein